MPIEIKAVTKEEFEQWVEKAKEEFTFNYNDNLKFASVEGVL
jgi:heme/copper-type cytochrome/quinol oxidase subunit 2